MHYSYYVRKINPFSTGPDYIRFFSFLYYHINYHILNMPNKKCDIKSARFEKS